MSYNLLFDRPYCFRQGRPTANPLFFLSDTWPFSIWVIGETFSVVLDISKVFDRFSHKAFISKLPTFSFYPFFCAFISDNIFGHSTAAVVDRHCPSPKAVVFLRVLFYHLLYLLFSNDLSCISSRNYFYFRDSTLHHSIWFAVQISIYWRRLISMRGGNTDALRQRQETGNFLLREGN